MATSPSIYPAKEIFKALKVLKVDFDIANHDELYVDFDGARSEASFSSLMIKLGILKDKLSEEAGNAKILYTGHTGSGKSTELLKLHQKLNNPERYFSIYIDLDDYFQVSTFHSEDLLVLLISALVNALAEQDINYNVSGLNKISDEWMQDKEVKEEVQSKIDNQAGAEIEAGVSLWSILKTKAFLKTIFSYNSNTSTTIRRKIKEKQGDYIVTLNQALLEIKSNIRRAGKGKVIVFIIDGIEKLRYGKYDTYIETFFQNVNLINDLQCSLICCVPIDSLYDKNTSPLVSIYQHFTLPLIPINDKTISLFSEIITKRVDKDTFFESDALEYCVSQSGGSPRQLIRIVEMSLTYSEASNFKITLNTAQKVCKELGLDLWHRLTAVQHEKLKKGDYEGSDQIILDMLFSLALMAYNGDIGKRLPNPLLKSFLTPLIKSN